MNVNFELLVSRFKPDQTFQRGAAHSTEQARAARAVAEIEGEVQDLFEQMMESDQKDEDTNSAPNRVSLSTFVPYNSAAGAFEHPGRHGWVEEERPYAFEGKASRDENGAMSDLNSNDGSRKYQASVDGDRKYLSRRTETEQRSTGQPLYLEEVAFIQGDRVMYQAREYLR